MKAIAMRENGRASAGPAIAIAIFATWPALAQTIAGPVRPMDGDTFEMAGVGVIRLADIDAPEMAQKCQGGPKELRDCGAFVADVWQTG